MFKTQELKIKCSEAELAATLFIPAKCKSAVMMAPATGIKRSYYYNFAGYLSEHGFGVITYNNEGIGDSLRGNIRRSDASLIKWGVSDMPCVFRHLKNYFPDTSYHVIGHSSGGQLIGLMNNSHEIKSVFNFACSSGCLNNMEYPFKLKAKFFMNIFIPLNNLIFGFTNAQWVGMGERLPKIAAQQWAAWCNGSGYVKTAFGKTIKEHWYDELNIPSLWVNATDDKIANNKNVDEMINVFTKMKAQRLILDPKEYKLREIGHMKFFSRENKVLWKITLDWLNSNL